MQARQRSTATQISEKSLRTILFSASFLIVLASALASANLQLTSELNTTLESGVLQTQLSTGENLSVLVMASDAQIKASTMTNATCADDCQVYLKEKEFGGKKRAVYEVTLRKEAKILGIFPKRMELTTDVDAETGSILQVNKPWWGFLATEGSSSITGNAVSDYDQDDYSRDVGANSQADTKSTTYTNTDGVTNLTSTIIVEAAANLTTSNITNKSSTVSRHSGGGGGSGGRGSTNPDPSPASDTTSPSVVAFIPGADASDVLINSDLAINFSEDIQTDTFNVSSVTLLKNSAVIASDVIVGNSSIIINPHALLLPLTTYTVKLIGEVRDLAGNTLEANYSWNFTTESGIDLTAPHTTDNAPTGQWNNYFAHIVLNATDDYSGVDKTLYCVDTINSCTPNIEGNDFTLEQNGVFFIRYNSVDRYGNVESVHSVKVQQDTSIPYFVFNESTTILPAFIEVYTTSSSGKNVTFMVRGQDSVGGYLDATCSPRSGSIFPIGNTQVNCQIVDYAGNSNSSSFEMRIIKD